MKELKKKYKDKNFDQKINFCVLLKSLKDMLKTKLNNICKYSRQFRVVSSKPIKLS